MTILIKPDGTGDQPTIQAGISAASPGDTVLLAEGAYYDWDNYNLDFGGPDLVLISESGLMREFWKKYDVQLSPDVKKAYGVE